MTALGKTDWATGDLPAASDLTSIGTGLNTLQGWMGAQLNAIYSRATADVTVNNTTTLANVTGCSFAVGVSDTWIFLFSVNYTSGTTPDIDLAISVPASPTSLRYGVIGDSVAATSASSATASNTRLGLNGRALDEAALVCGILVNGANSGTVQLKMSQTTATVSNTTVYTNSFVYAIRVG